MCPKRVLAKYLDHVLWETGVIPCRGRVEDLLVEAMKDCENENNIKVTSDDISN